MTLDQAQDAFRAEPTNERAGAYLHLLLIYEMDDMIGDDTFLDGLSEIGAWLDPHQTHANPSE